MKKRIPTAVIVAAASGEIPAFKVGKRIWRFEKAALMKSAGAKTKK